MMVPGEVMGLLIPEPGIHMVRVDARRTSSPKKAELRAFGNAVAAAVREAGGRA